MHPEAALPDDEAARPRRPLLWWDIAIAAVTLIMGVAAVADARPPDPRLTAALGLLALIVLGYLALGRTALRRGGDGLPTTTAGYAFLALLIVLVGTATAVLPAMATLQAIAYPMIWWTAERTRDAILASGALAAAVGAGTAAAYTAAGVPDPVIPAVTVAGLSFAFSVAMGTWITRMVARGEQYREIAERLRASQEEVAALSAAAGAAAERERLSRELHDTLTQTLTGLLMLGDQVDRALDAGAVANARERLSRLQAASRTAVEEARALVATTHPLGDGGLEQAIQRVAASLRDDAGLPVRCELETLALDRERQVVLLRAAQEGLANARKHARATTATVILRGEGPNARLIVEDDGVGPATTPFRSDGETAPVSGFGLSGLRDRVRLVGGDMRFEAREAGGSRLDVRVPLAAGARSEATR